jgi:hypothetical protein
MEKLNFNQMEKINGGLSGQAAVDCIKDVYENHGWSSWGMWALTIIQPEIGLTVAAACGVVGVLS